MFGEKGCELVKGDIFELVVKINMPRVRNDVEFLWVSGKNKGSGVLYAELLRFSTLFLLFKSFDTSRVPKCGLI